MTPCERQLKAQEIVNRITTHKDPDRESVAEVMYLAAQAEWLRHSVTPPSPPKIRPWAEQLEIVKAMWLAAADAAMREIARRR